MAVTAKQIADQLGISAAAVSLALNNRRGVSEKTRQLVLSTAEALGYDFSKIKFERQKSGTVALVAFNRRRIFARPFFADMLAGVEGALRHAGFSFSLVNYSPFENTQQQIADIAEAQYDGVIILATEMFESDFMPFASLDCPLLLLDSCMSAGVDTVKIDNAASMMLAVQYLHSKYGSVPGLLTTPVTVSNFTERRFAYEHAIGQLSGSEKCGIIHELAVAPDEAYADMLDIIDSGEPLAQNYVAVFDDIAIGAMKAFIERGYRVPDDVRIVGFDNNAGGTYVQPQLTTLNVPSEYMAPSPHGARRGYRRGRAPPAQDRAGGIAHQAPFCLELAHALALDKIGRDGRFAGIALGIADVAHQTAHRDLAHLVLGNMHRGEWRVGEGAHGKIVEANHRDIFGHANAMLAQRTHSTHGEDVVLGKESRRQFIMRNGIEPCAHVAIGALERGAQRDAPCRIVLKAASSSAWR